MSHLVFARKYRPQTFKEIVGQEHVTKALMNAIARNRVPHALLFTGPRGVGKTTSARVLSKALNCTGRPLPTNFSSGSKIQNIYDAIEPCGKCPNCIDIAKSSNLAVVEIDGASNNSVDNVRQLIETLLTAPPPNIKYKIYIIDEVHMLSVAAFNALLKTLEEPPPNTIFIFATTEPHKIPDTVISRCQQHDFRRFSIKNVREQLRFIVKAEDLEVDDDVLNLIAKKCFGGMRDASTLLERVISFSDDAVTIKDATQILGVFDFEFYAQIIENVCLGKQEESLLKVGEAFASAIDIKGFFSDLVSSFRQAYLYSLAKQKSQDALKKFIHTEELSDVDEQILSSLAELASPQNFLNLYDESRAIADTALKSQYPRYVLEVGIVKMCRLDKIIDLVELVTKLQQKTGDLAVVSSPKKKQLNDSMLQNEASSSHGYYSGNAIPASMSEVDLKKKLENPIDQKSLESAQEEYSKVDFSWTEFLRFVKKSGSITLEAYLKKVAPKDINIDDASGRGSLTLVASYFVSHALSDKDTMDTFRKLLGQYSRINSWQISVDTHLGSENYEPAPSTNSEKVNHVPGSFEGNNYQRKMVKVKKIEEEAREDDFIKHTLSVFSGTVIEKVSSSAKTK